MHAKHSFYQLNQRLGLHFNIIYMVFIPQLKNQARSYLDEVKWLHEGRIPSMEEYMGVATVSVTYTFLITISLLVMGNTATKETFEWLSNDPKILRASNIIFRLMNDIFSSQVYII